VALASEGRARLHAEKQARFRGASEGHCIICNAGLQILQRAECHEDRFTRWHLAQKKLRRPRVPCTFRVTLPAQAGHTLRP